MWKLDEKSAFDVVELFCVMCLASISFRTVGDNSSEQAGIALHDLHLEFCKMQLKSKNVECLWHLALLNGYFEGSVEPLEFSSQQLLEFIPRPWWSFETPKDTYLHGNLARHLSKAGLTLELAALLMDARWTNARGTFGGLLGLKADFDILDNVLSGSDSEKEESVSSDDIRQSFRLIFKAIQLSWGGFSDGPRAFQFQVCGRLLKLRESNVIVDAYLHSFAVYTSKPYLMPTSQFYPCLNTAQTLEIPVGGRCGCVVCSPCGQYFAAGTGCDIVIADVTTGDIVHRLQGHSDHVCCVTFMAGSKKVVSGSKDKTVFVWERESSDVPVLVLRGHRAAVTGVAVSSNEEVIFSSSRDGTLKVWNGSTGSQDREFAQGSPVLCVDIFVNSGKLAIGLHNGALKVLNSLTGKAIFENAEAHTGSVTSVAFSPDGKLLATASFDMTIRLWNASTGRAIGGPVEGHSNWVTSVAFSPDGQKIVSGSHRCEGTVRLWDIGSANSVDSSSNHPALSERASFSSHSALSVTFSSRGEGIMSGSSDGIVRIWSTLFRSEPRQQVVGHIAEVRGIAISHDGLRVASGSKDKTVRLWETQTGSRIGIPLRGHTRAVCCVSFSPDGRQVVSGSEDNTLRLWDAETFSQIGDPFEGHSNWVKCVSFSTDGLRIVSGAFDKTVRLWNVQTHKQIGAPLIPDSNRVMAVSESANGHFVVSLDRYSKVSIWNRSSRSIVWKSNKGDEDSSHTIADEQADVIIRSCGQEAPHLWPNTFPTYTSEVYCKNVSVYSDVRGEATSLGNLPSSAKNWKYNEMRKVFAAGLPCGTVAISRFISKSG